jgi:gluconate 2-dehydrogenase gamma chain
MPDSLADGSAPLDADQVALLTAVVDRLIPSDALGPGARAAHADQYILQALGGPYRRYRDDYAAGLASIEARALAGHGARFVDLDAAGQDSVLAEIEQATATRDGPAPRSFFDLVLKHTREGVFGDPRWGGNADRVGWTMIGYGGPRFTWAAEDQALGVVSDRKSV